MNLLTTSPSPGVLHPFLRVSGHYGCNFHVLFYGVSKQKEFYITDYLYVKALSEIILTGWPFCVTI